MEDISTEIKEKLKKFKGGKKAKPAESYPFFVSHKAYEFSGCPEDHPLKNEKPKKSGKSKKSKKVK